MNVQSETSGYLQTGAVSLYVTVHRPAEGGPAGHPLLLLGPFGEEHKCAYRLLVQLARAEAGRGRLVVRFDYRGAGESAGRHSDATLESWLADAGAVTAAFSDEAGPGGWILLGARLGANLALRLSGTVDARRTLLLEPLLNGTDYLRDLQRRKQIKEMMGGGEARTSEEQMQERWDSGAAVDFDGFEVGPALAEDLRGVDLREDLDAHGSGGVDLVRVTPARQLSGAWKDLAETLRAGGNGTVRVVRERPFWGQIEYDEFQTLQDEVLQVLAQA